MSSTGGKLGESNATWGLDSLDLSGIQDKLRERAITSETLVRVYVQDLRRRLDHVEDVLIKPLTWIGVPVQNRRGQR